MTFKFTPPIGINVYVMKRVAPDVPLTTIFRGAAPFAGVTLIVVFLIIAFPGLALWLPSTMN